LSIAPQDVSLTVMLCGSLQVDDKQAPFMCLDLSFCHSLITQGFKIAENSKITLVKRIQYKNEEVEAAWPLGAAINMLNN